MAFRLDEALEVLERTPGTLQQMLGGLSEGWIRATEGPETWRPFVVLGHLIHGEEVDWIARAKIILEDGESRAFDPFDREAQFRKYGYWAMGDLLARFAELRRENLATLGAWNLGAEALARRGRHPNLGVVSLAQLLATWTAHDLGHVIQISRVMAKRHRKAVGPWAEYLSVMAS